MLPISLRLKDVGPFKDETIDFCQFPGDVTAIVGENGAGKTMLIESVFAALYRYFPCRDSLFKYCQGRDARIELTFQVEGIRYQSIININAVKREMEPYLLQMNGKGTMGAAVTDGKNSTFDAAIANLCGSPDIVLASSFATQNKKGSFISLPKADRKTLFIDMLGLSRLQVISDLAAKHASECAALYLGTFGKTEALKILTEKTVDVAGLHQALEVLRQDRAKFESTMAGDQAEVLRLKTALAGKPDLESSCKAASSRYYALDRDAADARHAMDAAQALSLQVPVIKQTVEERPAHLRKLDELKAEQGRLGIEQLEHLKRQASYKERESEITKDINEHTFTIKSLTKNIERAEADAALISTVPCHAEGECAECQFLTNAAKAKSNLDTFNITLDNAKAKLLASDQQLKALVKPDAEFLVGIEKKIFLVKREIAEQEKLLKATEDAPAQLAKAEAAEAVVRDLGIRVARLVNEMESVKTELSGIARKLDDLDTVGHSLDVAEGNLRCHRGDLDAVNTKFNATVLDIARAEAANEAAVKAQAEIAVLNKQLETLDQDRKSWDLLSKAFGKTGVQSLEIDVAGPTVSEIANDLLFSCFGPRFSIRFITQVLKEDKSGYKDVFDIWVSDSEAEREGSIDDLSGGEKVIVNEAISLAIALFNRRRSTVSWGSLFRDESSSAVDDKRAPHYINMLRRARERGHFEKLFFIAHQARVTEMADSQVEVVKGKIQY